MHPAHKNRVRVRVRVALRLAVYRQSLRLCDNPLRLTTSNYIFQRNTCGYSPYVTSSLTRGWVCRWQLLLVLGSAVILRSESHGTHDHILLSQIRDSPNLESQVPVHISPRNRVALLYPQALGSLFVASCDSQGYRGGIRPRFHTGFDKNLTFLSVLFPAADAVENSQTYYEIVHYSKRLRQPRLLRRQRSLGYRLWMGFWSSFWFFNYADNFIFLLIFMVKYCDEEHCISLHIGLCMNFLWLLKYCDEKEIRMNEMLKYCDEKEIRMNEILSPLSSLEDSCHTLTWNLLRI
jgi:hypothetical protein